MTNLIKKVSEYLKVNYPNVYIVIISGLITMWFNYFTRLSFYYMPKGGIYTKWSIFIIVTLLLYMGDGSLSELYNFEHTSKVVGVNAAIQDQDSLYDTRYGPHPSHSSRKR